MNNEKELGFVLEKMAKIVSEMVNNNKANKRAKDTYMGFVLEAFEKKSWKAVRENMSKVKMKITPHDNELLDDFQTLFSEAEEILNRLEQ